MARRRLFVVKYLGRVAESVCVLKCPSVKLNLRDFLGEFSPKIYFSRGGGGGGVS